MKTQTVLIGLVIVALTAQFAMASQREPAAVWRSFAERLEAGAFVRVRLVNHRQVKGYIVMVDGDVLRLKPKTRVPVPIRDLQFADIESIERQKEGWSPGKKVLVGIGIGGGVVLAVAAVIVATAWD